MQRDLPLPGPVDVPGVTFRPQTIDDVDALGSLYWDSYPKGAAAVDLEDATEEMEGVFEGEYGKPLEAASLVAVEADGRLIGCIQTVTEAPWEGVPRGPFVVELFVHPEHRRRGLGSVLLLAAARGCAESGWEQIALNVQEETSAEAIYLYRKLGFEEIEPTFDPVVGESIEVH